MPVSLPSWRVNISRIGAMIISWLTILVPYHLEDMATPCLTDYANKDGNSGGAHRRQLAGETTNSSFDASAYDDDFRNKDGKLSTVQGLVTVSMLILASFIVALGSLDPKREESCKLF
jgi:hypothetical protein